MGIKRKTLSTSAKLDTINELEHGKIKSRISSLTFLTVWKNRLIKLI